MENIYYKKALVSLRKENPNFVAPPIPIITKRCGNCKGVLELKPLRTPWIRTGEGYYLVNRDGRGRLNLRNEMITEFIYWCRDCSYGEPIRIKQPKDIIEVMV